MSSANAFSFDDYYCCFIRVNPLPNEFFLDMSILKAFADNKINVTKNQKFNLENGRKLAGKGENAGYQHFLFFPKCFQQVPFSGSLKVGIVSR